MSCQRCGKCCTYVVLIFKNHRQGDDFGNWLGHHGWEIGQQEDGMTLTIQQPCLQLQHDQNGLASCGIYQDRPQTCKEYLCTQGRE